MKPIIGINVDIIIRGVREVACIQSTYYDAVLKAGGIPVLIPPMPTAELEMLLKKLDGLMMIGGDDYSPSLYGQPQHESVELTHKTREEFDLLLAKKAVNDLDVPILGICAGCQVINIAMGGTLIQDIPSVIPDSDIDHSSNGNRTVVGNLHRVKILPDSKLSRLYHTEVAHVPTSHHQSVGEVAKGFRAVAFADDGVIEAIENPDKPFLLGVQWHPERDFDGNKTLFESFVQAAIR